MLDAGGGGRSGILEVMVVLLDCWGCWLTEMAFLGRIGELKLTT